MQGGGEEGEEVGAVEGVGGERAEEGVDDVEVVVGGFLGGLELEEGHGWFGVVNGLVWK